MTILRQLGLAASTLMLMVTVSWSRARPELLFVIAYIGGWATSRYDEGAAR